MKKYILIRKKKGKLPFLKSLSGQGYGFSSSHVWMWELDYKESWVPKNWCFWTVVLEKTLESPFVGGNRQNRLHLESRTPSWAGLWTLSYMPSTYGNDMPTGKTDPRKEEPQGSPSPKKTPNYLCNWIESYILKRLLGYDHKPIDKCPLFI